MHLEMGSRSARAVPLFLFGAVWQFVCSAHIVDTEFLPTPAMVGAAMVDLLSGGDIANNIFLTLFRAGAGLILGSI